MNFETFLAMAAGAFAYHMYKKISDLEEVTGALAEHALEESKSKTIHLGGAFERLDADDEEEDTEEARFRFGFTA